MIFATVLVLQRLLTFNQAFKIRISITATISAATVVFSMIHCKINDLNIHSAVFASMIAFIAYRGTVLTKHIKDPARRQNARRLARSGCGNDWPCPFLSRSTEQLTAGNYIVCAGAGFAIWLLDSLACSSLRRLRRQVGLPLGFLLELHGW